MEAGSRPAEISLILNYPVVLESASGQYSMVYLKLQEFRGGSLLGPKKEPWVENQKKSMALPVRGKW